MFRNQWKTTAFTLFTVASLGVPVSSLTARAEITLMNTSTPVNCTTTNCKSLRVFGAINKHTDSANVDHADPWLAQFKLDSGSCARFDVIGAKNDLEMTVIEPNGTIYRNDDKNGVSDRKPLVVITNPSNGIYTVAVYSFSGAPLSEQFSMAVKQYTPASNPNCSPATTGIN